MNYNYQNTYNNVSTSDSRMTVMRNTYLLLAFSMIPTAIGALLGMSMALPLLAGTGFMGMIVLLGAVYFMMFMIQKNKHSFAGIVWMMFFTFLMGALLGPLLTFTLRLNNGANLILLAATLTSSIFFIMSGIGFVTKKEMPMLNSFLAIGFWVLLAGMIANIFLQLPMMQLMICGGFVIFSSLGILWQVNQIVIGGETSCISATLTLYVQLYNLFTSLLRIIIALSGNDRR